MRKVLLVGVPSVFPERGGTAQLFWGLLVCFSTFGMYMMYAPFVKDSDDLFSQLAQLQIFLTLLSSLALRSTPPSAFVGSLVTYVLFLVPGIGLVLETPLLSELKNLYGKAKGLLNVLFPSLKFEPPSNIKILGPPKVAPSSRNRVDPSSSESQPDEITQVTPL